MGSRLALPAITFSNVRSLSNKMTELAALVKYDRHYRQNSLICVTESWLTEESTGIDLEGFTTIRFDKDKGKGENRKGGRGWGWGNWASFVNNSWATLFSVRKTVSTKDYETVTVTFRPFYPPLEFGQVTVILVYVPGPDKARAAERIAHSYNKAVVSRAVDRPGILTPVISVTRFLTWNSLSRSPRGTSALWTNVTVTFPTHLPHGADPRLENRTTMLCTLCLHTDRN